MPPSGVIATAVRDSEQTAMLTRAAVSFGLEVNRPLSPEPSQLDDWLLGVGAFLPRGVWAADEVVDGPFNGQIVYSLSAFACLPSPFSLPSMTGLPRCTQVFPRWRKQSRCTFSQWNADTWRNHSRLPSKAFKLTAALAAKDYSAVGQAASALHATAIQQEHQAKALKQMHEGSADPGLMQELSTATDFALRATKVMARSLGKAIVHHGGPRAPSLTQPGRDEGCRQSTLSWRPISQAWLFYYTSLSMWCVVGINLSLPKFIYTQSVPSFFGMSYNWAAPFAGCSWHPCK